ncbi:alcohol dehydrogenase [Erwinia typographi]|uniref:Alcohol dehydrogenase n=1 Tax=Erwinia typographi TaxID=371042 RepID=A0A0A3YIC6_9GAMM|nr:NADP-dependent oxidoreductase [Erwinia typographi]KGT86487.1 alcohol dehydrogenase [Erwinia typographi]
MNDVDTMRTLRFHTYGSPSQVLQLDQAPIPFPGSGKVRVRVEACALNPADWALCQGLFPGSLPRGVGLDVAGTITAIGEEATGVSVGDRVFGAADYSGYASAGASDQAVLHHWASIPPGLGMIEAAALPMAIETASRYLAVLDLKPGQTLLVNGAGTMIGFAAVQIALLQGLRVIATAGARFSDQLRARGVFVTSYGAGLVDRLRALLPEPPDHVLDVAPVNMVPDAPSALPDLVTIAGGDPKRVLTVTDHAGAAATGARTGIENIKSVADVDMHWDKLDEYAHHAAAGRFSIPIARAFALEDWREALDISLSGHAGGKLILLIAPELLNESR